jgi:hypothetical protein
MHIRGLSNRVPTRSAWGSSAVLLGPASRLCPCLELGPPRDRFTRYVNPPLCPLPFPCPPLSATRYVDPHPRRAPHPPLCPLPFSCLPLPQFFDADYFRQDGVKDLIKEHSAAFPGETKLPQGCLPDHGNGRFSAQLSYKNWMMFNSYQRAHANLLEMVTTVLVSLLIGGLFFPDYATYAGAAWIVGRELYTYGYMTKGPNGRGVGAGIADIGMFALIIMSLYGPLSLIFAANK